MILSKNVLLKMNNRCVKHYINKGYNVKGGQTIEVNIDDLTNKRNVLIHVMCDHCCDERHIPYVAYNRYTKNKTEEYYCQKCNNIKRKISVKEKYGVDNILESDIIRDKMKKTMIERYGNEHALNILEFKEKMKETNNIRFGCDYAATNEDIKNKIKNTFLKNYGVTTSLLDKNTQIKIENTNLEKYGAKNVFELYEFRVKPLLEKYGVEYALKLDIFMEKLEQTNINNFGHKNPMSNDDIKNKMIKTKQKLGIYLNECDRKDFTNYRLKVKSFTNKNKKELYENWNGYDFYDNEYIKDNIKNDRNYPTIDHKISVKYGFDNNISPEEISNMCNLCITKRGINSSKGSNCR